MASCSQLTAVMNSRPPPLPPLAPVVEEVGEVGEAAEETAVALGPPQSPPPRWPLGVAAGGGGRSQQLPNLSASHFLETLHPAGGAKTNWPVTTGWRHLWLAAG